MGMYQDMFDKQVALTLSQHGGLGLGAALTRAPGAASAPAASGPATTAPPSTAASTAAAATGATPGEFVSRVLPAIRRAATTLGVSPLGLLAQAALETGWGQRMPRTADGSSSLNLFGIKADQSWEGARAPATTLEYRDGVATPQRTTFRAYGSLEQSVSDFANLLGSSPRLRAAPGAAATPAAYVDHIANAGYATDPEYADKLNKMLNSKVFRDAVAASGIRI
jgi:flagellar protein FlgJ